jgi:rubrerythrin
MNTVNSLEVLREAMQLEKDGVRFYLRAAKACKHKRTKALFKGLANDELNHLEKLELVYDNLATNNEWLVDEDILDTKPKLMKDLEAFEEDIQIEGGWDEQKALEHGIKAEEDSIRLYQSALNEFSNERGGAAIFKWLLSFERDHLLRLQKRRSQIGRSD